jgi:hypothetical protein
VPPSHFSGLIEKRDILTLGIKPACIIAVCVIIANFARDIIYEIIDLGIKVRFGFPDRRVRLGLE